MNCFFVILFAIIQTLILAVTNGEVFTAMSDVESLIDSERRVVSILRNLIEAEKKKLGIIEE